MIGVYKNWLTGVPGLKLTLGPRPTRVKSLHAPSIHPSIIIIMSNIAELAVPYAILALHDDNVEITEENVMKLLKAANIEVEAIWVSIFVKAFEGKNIADMLTAFSSAPVAVAAAPAAGGGAAPAAAAKEEAKKEVKEESDDDMGFGLFD